MAAMVVSQMSRSQTIMLNSSLAHPAVRNALAVAPKVAAVVVALSLLSACGVGGTAIGGALDLTGTAIGTVADVATAPF